MSSSTYFQYHGNSEMQTSAADGLQTLIFMNPAAYNNDNNNNNNNISYDPQQTSHNFSNYQHHHQQQEDDPTSTYNFRGFFPNHNVHSYNNNLFNPQIDSPRAQRGLSLSLQPHQGYGSFMTEKEARPSQLTDDVKSPSSSVVSVGLTQSTSSVVLSSKYLKAAQEILDEVVNAGSYGSVVKTVGKCSTNAENGVDEGSSSKRGTDPQQQQLSTAERQEIQMKKAKLLNMLHEVEQRYKQYYHQMQIVISWFEQATRTGSAKTYTDLALQTISKQFRSLKDAILGQIRNASKSLGEEESSGGKAEGSRLKYVDNQIRQQRALQQLGMVQHNAWRPQRGLPERSVSVLRAWLFEHFLHPYPKDSDKIILAKQTGLTRSQVSNWFINARVRLWKPMVEEMYKEEMKGRENNGSEDHKMTKSEENEDSTSKSTAQDIKTPTIKNQNKNFTPKQDNPNNQNTASLISMSTNATSPTGANNTGFSLIGFSEMDSITQGSPKKPRNPEILHSTGSIPWMNMDSKPNNVANDHMSMKFGDERQSRDEFSLMGAPTNFIGGFGSYPIAELGRFGAEEEQFQAPYSGNGVSLTLGLPHCENLSMAGSHQSFMPNQSMQLGRGLEIGDANDFNGMTTPTSAHSTNAYEEISIQNRKRFATELLPDFIT